MRRLQHLDLAHCHDRFLRERAHAPCIGARSRLCHPGERTLERIGSLPGRAERQAHRLQVRVLHGELEDATIQHFVSRELASKLLQQLRFIGIAELAQQRRELAVGLLHQLSRSLGFTRELARGFVGVRHHRAVRGVGCLREVRLESCRELARLGAALEDRARARRAAPDACDGEHDERREHESPPSARLLLHIANAWFWKFHGPLPPVPARLCA
jgi:hypothetical protein